MAIPFHNGSMVVNDCGVLDGNDDSSRVEVIVGVSVSVHFTGRFKERSVEVAAGRLDAAG